MRICIISSIGHQTYQGKFSEMKPAQAPFWKLALMHDGTPLDVVDYYHLEKQDSVIVDPNRHIYTNGILLANRLYNPGDEIVIVNSLDESTTFDSVDVAVISTNYVTTNWESCLIMLLARFRAMGIKCVIGGIGIKKLYLNDSQFFPLIVDAVDGYIVIADNGLSVMRRAVEGVENQSSNKLIICEDEYVLSYKDFSLEHIDVSLHSKHTALITQAGCIYDCAFCSYKEKYKDHAVFDLNEIKKTLMELDKTNKQGLRHIRFADETFNVDINRVIELCDFIAARGFSFRWSCFLRANNITPELIRALAHSNCDFVSIGVESGNAHIQRIMNKNVELKGLKQSIAELRSAGIVVNVSLLVGFFGECDATIQDTMDYVSSCGADLARVNLWYPARSEKNHALFEQYHFRTENGLWRHDSTTEQRAAEYARQIYLMDSTTVFIPPFSSVFDQWPVLSSYGLEQNEILSVFKSYYLKTKLQDLNTL